MISTLLSQRSKLTIFKRTGENATSQSVTVIEEEEKCDPTSGSLSPPDAESGQRVLSPSINRRYGDRASVEPSRRYRICSCCWRYVFIALLGLSHILIFLRWLFKQAAGTTLSRKNASFSLPKQGINITTNTWQNLLSISAPNPSREQD